ncbi:MAG TPA: hypothetical protein VGI04_05870 [Neobacillus sp.]
MKKYLILLMGLTVAGSLLGCQQQADQDIKDKIQFVPEKNYVGDPHPVVKEKMKLTDEEKQDFDKLQQEISSQKEGK